MTTVKKDKLSDEKEALLRYEGFNDRLEEIKDLYRIKKGDDLNSFDIEQFVSDMRVINEGVIPCWELKNCERWVGGEKEEELGMCLTFPWFGWTCWAIAGTLCGGVVQGSAANKEGNCQMCPHYITLMEGKPEKYKADSAYFSLIMQQMLIGVCTINPKGIIDYQSSQKFQEFFGLNVAGKKLTELLELESEETSGFNEWVKDAFELFGALSWDMLYDLYPLANRSVKVKDGYYRINISPFTRKDSESGQETLFRLLVQVSDVSTEVRAMEIAAEERIIAEMVMVRVKNLNLFKEFIAQSSLMLPTAEELVRKFIGGDYNTEYLEEAYRLMHTLKGSSGIFAMDNFVKTAHDAENFFDNLLKICERDNAGDDIKKSIYEYREVFNNFRRLKEEIEKAVKFMADQAGIDIEAKVEEGPSVNVSIKTLNETINLILSKKPKEAKKLIEEAKQTPVTSLFQEVETQVERISSSRGKEVSVFFGGKKLRVDKEIQIDLSSILMHMVRNAIDHGIEAPDERVDAGKEPIGLIKIDLEKDNEKITLHFKDDGRGVDIAKVREKAGLNVTATEEEALREVFRPGFSTIESANTISGRGVGLDVVKSIIEDKYHGNININTEQSTGTEFILTIPS